MVFKDVTGFEGLYKISSDGKVWEAYFIVDSWAFPLMIEFRFKVVRFLCFGFWYGLQKDQCLKCGIKTDEDICPHCGNVIEEIKSR